MLMNMGMKMNQRVSKAEILKYIQNEKDIARYQIKQLEKNKEPSLSRKRILEIEREFVSLPFEEIPFEDLADVAAAISFYRTSRSQFFSTYKIKIPEQNLDNKDLLSLLSRKIKFLKNISIELKNLKTQELNYIQNTELYFDLIKDRCRKNKKSFDLEKKILDGKSLDDLVKIEPLVLAKKRARIQAALYSLGEYIDSKILEAKENSSPDEITKLQKDLDLIIYNLEDNIFEFYNQSLTILPGLLQNTMGKNNYISKIHPLRNLLDFENLQDKIDVEPIASHNFSKNQPAIGNLLFGQKKAIAITQEKDSDRNIQNKVFGILLPIPHEGNEKMSPLFKSIFLDDIDITNLFSKSICNIKANHLGRAIYCKALLMHPLWKLREISDSISTYKPVVSKILGLSLQEFSNYDFNNQSVISKINSNLSSFINISSKSRVYSAKTRSEEEGISEIIGTIKSKILEIKQEYNSL